MNRVGTIYGFIARVLPVAAAMVIPVLFGCSPEPAPRLPNVILILADDLGYGDVECLNPDSKIPTPNLNRLAGEGILFTNAHAPAAVCTPTRYSILTGRYPWRSRLKQGVLWIWDPPLIEKERFTMGEMLQQQGYHTACIGKWHLGWEWPTNDGAPPTLSNEGRNVDYTRKIEGGPLSHGFQTYFGDDVPGFPPHAFIENDRMVVQPSQWKEGAPGAPGAMAPGWTYEALLPAITQKASGYIEERVKGDPDQPFFLFFSLSAPHTPIAPAPEFIGKSEAGRYGDFVYQVDHTVGQIMQTLDRLGIRENTLLIFSSDNGAIPVDGENYVGSFGSIYNYGHDPNGKLRGVKSDAWEGGHREPLMVRWPGHIAPGGVSHEMVSLTDLMATLAAVSGFEIPDSCGEDSHNMLPLLLGNSDSPVRETLVTQSGNGILALQRGDWKLIMSSGSGGSWSKPSGAMPTIDTTGGAVAWKNIQLYNLKDDLEEQSNLAPTHPELVSELAALLAGEINRGRSTPGRSLQKTGQGIWEQVSWLNEFEKHK